MRPSVGPGRLPSTCPTAGRPIRSPHRRRGSKSIRPTIFLSAAVFDGEPAGPCKAEPQTCDLSGTNFRIGDPPLVIVESQLRYNRGKDADGLPGTVKLGAYGHFGKFDDQRFASNGLPLAVAGQNAMPVQHSPNGAFYGIIDQQVYRVPGDDDEKGIGIFTRVIGAPQDRNLVDFYVDGGFSALGLVPSRPHDFFGIAAAFAKISPAASAADVDANAVSRIPGPVRSFEAIVEVTYQAEVVPGLALQPTFQYIAHPGGNVADPYGTGGQAIPNAKVFGVTTTVRF